jgi:hypothetical protein
MTDLPLPTALPLCKDCRFCILNPTYGWLTDHKHGEFDLCVHPQSLRKEGETHFLVTGDIKLSEHYHECTDMRDEYHKCGREGHHFQPRPPKPSFWQTVKSKVFRPKKALQVSS